MPTIHLSVFIYKGRQFIRISFDVDERVRKYILAFPRVQWSHTYTTYYLPYSRTAFHTFYRYLRQENFYVDYSQIPRDETISPGKRKAGRAGTVSKLGKRQLLIYREYCRYLLGLRLSSNTISTYSNFVATFLYFINKKPIEQLSNSDVQRFVEAIIQKKKYSISTHRQLISALKHFAARFTKAQIDAPELIRPAKNKRLPTVLSKQEVVGLLRATPNLKHRMALALLYSAGLRIGELISLKIADIDTERRQIRIQHAKGRKDRYGILAESILPLLHNYLMTYRPIYYFIEGPKHKKYSEGSVRKFLQRACQRAGIKKHCTPHTLRHSYATHLIENGVGLRHVQELLGHSKPETTMIYTHVAQKDLLQIQSPLDATIFELLESDKNPLKLSLSRTNKG
jgi:site-specific recombinase XerD